MNSFIGLPVRVVLSDQSIVQGVVSGVNAETAVLTLGDVLVDKNGTQQHHRSYSVSGSLISDLRVLPVDSRSAQISSQIPASDPAVLLYSTPTPGRVRAPVDSDADGPTSSEEEPRFNAGQAPTSDLGDKKKRLEQQRQVLDFPQKPHSSKAPSRARKQPSGRNSPSNGRAWAETDTATYNKDFDFKGNLGLFDKAKIFDEIRSQDSTRPEELLVNINQRNKWEKNMVAEHQRKLRHDENVLSGSESDDEGSDLDVIIARSPSKGPESSSSARRPVFRTSVGVEICGLTAKEYLEVERLTIAETGPTEEQLIENAGRGCATMAMPALGGARRLNPRNIQHNSPPVVCVMAGNNRTGAIGIATARHLANHDCRVILMIVGGDEELSLANTIAQQRKCFVPTGGELVTSISQMPHRSEPVDLIIDALLGCQTMNDVSNERHKFLISELIRWANDNKAPTMSLDCPSGINATTGRPSSHFHIEPKWTLCLGSPKSGVTDRTLCGEIFLADIGIPRIVFDRVSVDEQGRKKFKYRSPYGDRFLVALELLSHDSGILE